MLCQYWNMCEGYRANGNISLQPSGSCKTSPRTKENLSREYCWQNLGSVGIRQALETLVVERVIFLLD